MLVRLLDGLEADGSLMDTTSYVSRWRELDTFSVAQIHQDDTTQPLQQAGATVQMVMLEAECTSEKKHFLSSEE